MSDVAGALAWLASGAGAVGGGMAAAAVHPVLVIPVLVIVTSLASLPLLIPTLALIALYSSDPDRQARAAEILNRLLAALRGGKQGEAEDQSEAAVDRFEPPRARWRRTVWDPRGCGTAVDGGVRRGGTTG